MAEIDDVISDVADADLRGRLQSAVDELRQNKRFGLVYEEHIPETVALPGTPPRRGDLVQLRSALGQETYRVESVGVAAAVVSSVDDGSPASEIPLIDLAVVTKFGEPVYPGLSVSGSVTRGSADRASHVVINAENYHAVQLLNYTHQGRVSVLYLDPPYNTGARDWKYNNRIVGADDAYRHSKWLSMMSKRLMLARRLMKPDGVMVITIDEHEVHHLGVLLEQLFPSAFRQMVTIMNNPKGVTQPRFSRVEEYAHFVFFGDAAVESRPDDLFTWGAEEAGQGGEAPRWKGLLRSGTNALPSDRPNMTYPIAIDPDTGRIMGAGESLRERHARGELAETDYDDLVPEVDITIDGYPVAWPIRKGGALGNWGLGRETLLDLAARGMARVGGYDEKRKTWAIAYLSAKLQAQVEAGLLEVVGRHEQTGVLDVRYIDVRDRRIKTIWHRSSHDAGTGGADLVGELLGSRSFDFPKSVYAVRDTLDALVASDPEAVIADFFAGSGTTLHATMLLNAQDGGRRQCLLVTNNEVDERTSRRLEVDGFFPGDAEYELHGIFEAVTKPRSIAAVTGARADGTALSGTYIGGRPLAEGFDENIEFFRMDYLDPDDVDLGRQYAAVVPMLWLMAGAIGPRDHSAGGQWSAPEGSTYAVLFEEKAARDFVELVSGRAELSHVFIVTDSADAFAEIRAELPGHVQHCSMLYRDYLRNFRIKAGGSS